MKSRSKLTTTSPLVSPPSFLCAINHNPEPGVAEAEDPSESVTVDKLYNLIREQG